ncbi:MAG: hypothetical protein AAB274_01590 [Nitrospirota bacterium]
MGEQNIPAKGSEEDLYAAALAEVQARTTHPGLWAKAFADSEGDENKSTALYIKLRVQQEIARVQQEQKAADVLAAETVRRKAVEFQAVSDNHAPFLWLLIFGAVVGLILLFESGNLSFRLGKALGQVTGSLVLAVPVLVIVWSVSVRNKRRPWVWSNWLNALSVITVVVWFILFVVVRNVMQAKFGI